MPHLNHSLFFMLENLLVHQAIPRLVLDTPGIGHSHVGELILFASHYLHDPSY